MGIVFDIQRFCLHDGPGLRTTVFLKGCPLACRWCSNPESQAFGPETLYNPARCVRCGSCAKACPNGAVRMDPGGPVLLDRAICIACGRCADACPTTAISVKGRDMTAAEVAGEVLKDKDFYETSGGGATISGGEPFAQPEFLLEILKALRAENISAAAESSLHAEWGDIELCLPLLDHLLVDVKHPDAESHREWTGAGPERIRENLALALARHPGVLLRIPVIPGFNTGAASFGRFAEFIAGLGAPGVELLPYHVLGEGKYAMLGRDYPASEVNAADAFDEAARMAEFLRSRGIDASVSG